jgi:hypothetical protein
MLVSLLTDGDEGTDTARIQGSRKRAKVVLATHGTVAHMLGKPCIHIFPRPKWHPYPLVHARNVLTVLNHESLHCAMQRLGVQDDVGFDALFRSVRLTRRFLEVP